LSGIRTVAGEQTGGAEDAHLGLAVVQFFAGLLAHGLEAVEVDVHRQRRDDFAVDHQREHDAGHQHVLAVDHIKVGFDHAWLEGGAWAGEPGVCRFTAGADAGVGHVAFRQRHRGECARSRLRPVQGEAALVVTAQLRLIGEQLVLAVQRVGFKHQGQTQQVRVGLQRGLDLAGQVFAGVEGIEEALFGLFAQEQDLTGKTVAVLVGIHELATNTQRLRFALGFDACLGGGVEHLHAGRLDLLRALRHAIQRQTHQ